MPINPNEIKVSIDPQSGFCFGVVYAISLAEKDLAKSDTLYCLGDIVHNNVEVKRLETKGLITINHEQFRKLKNCRVLIRAHGEPPETYRIAIQNNIELIDASCPVVLRLQNKIKEGFNDALKNNGQIVIYGKKGHAEVIGLEGQTLNQAIIVSDFSDLNKIDFRRPVTIFSQTTKDIAKYNKIIEEVRKRMLQFSNSKNLQLITHDTICRQVANRYSQIQEFSRKFDVIVFVSGRKSSNGKVLYEACKEVNSQTHFITESSEIDFGWFNKSSSIGICGATSTPRWLMEKVRNEIVQELNSELLISRNLNCCNFINYPEISSWKNSLTLI